MAIIKETGEKSLVIEKPKPQPSDIVVSVRMEHEDLRKCPNCGGEADNGHDRCLPPNVYYCTKCEGGVV